MAQQQPQFPCAYFLLPQNEGFAPTWLIVGSSRTIIRLFIARARVFFYNSYLKQTRQGLPTDPIIPHGADFAMATRNPYVASIRFVAPPSGARDMEKERRALHTMLETSKCFTIVRPAQTQEIARTADMFVKLCNGIAACGSCLCVHCAVDAQCSGNTSCDKCSECPQRAAPQDAYLAQCAADYSLAFERTAAVLFEADGADPDPLRA